MDIATRLKKLRELNKYSQSQIARLLKIAPGRYGHYETGVAKPSLDLLLQLCEIYHFNGLDDLLGIKYNPKALSPIEEKYYKAPPYKREIVDFVLNC